LNPNASQNSNFSKQKGGTQPQERGQNIYAESEDSWIEAENGAQNEYMEVAHS
jgi:hypothetical protein